MDVSDASLLRVIDVFADVEGLDCLAILDRATPASGSLAFAGNCDDGQHPGGYSIVFDLQLPVTITCDQDTRNEAMSFSGSVAITATLVAPIAANQASYTPPIPRYHYRLDPFARQCER